jgi:hypothetical protein
MSYICHATNELVIGEGCQFIPTEIRQVVYIAQIRPDKRTDYLQFGGQTEGWEVVKEVPVRNSLAEKFLASNTPEVVGQKEVRYIKPKTFNTQTKPKHNAPPRRDEGLVKLNLN